MFRSVHGLLAAAEDKPLWQAVLEDDCRDRDAAPEASMDRMEKLWQAMKESVEGYEPDRRSVSGLSG